MKSGNKSRWLAHYVAAFMVMAIICIDVAYLMAQSPQETYQHAGQLYQEKKYADAAAAYHQLLAQHYYNADIYYNLGNCYFKLDSVGKCILNYERALKLDHKDEDLAYNLKLARLKTVDVIQPVPQLAIVTQWNNLVNYYDADGWGFFAMVTLWLGVVAFGIALFSAGNRRGFGSIGAVFIVLTITGLLLALHQEHHENMADQAVVMVPGVFVKSAPDTGAGNLFMIHEGAVLQLLDKVDNWNKIRLEDGKVGWLSTENFERI